MQPVGLSARGERGTIFVIVALAMPVMLLFIALTLDVGNWYVTKSQLKNRADKGAVAAALAYGYLYPACTTDVTLEQRIVDTAKEFAGDPSGTTGYNSHPGDSASVSVNDDPCHDQGPSIESPGGGASTNVDVEDTVPSLMGGLGSLTDLYARSRVSVLQLASATALRPFAIADAALTQCAWVRFDGGSPQPLTRQDPFFYTATVGGLDSTGPDGGHPIRADVILGQGTAGCATPTAQVVTYPDVGYVLSWDSNGNNRPWIGDVAISGGCDGNPGFVPRTGGTCTIDVAAKACFTAATGNPVVELNNTPMSPPWPNPPGPGQPDCHNVNGSIQVSPGDGDPNGRFKIEIHAVNGNGLDATRNYYVNAGDDINQGPIADFRLSVVSNSTETGPVSGPFPGNPFTEDVSLRLNPLAVPGSPSGLDQPWVIRGSDANVGATSGPVSCPSTPLGDAVRRGCVRSVLAGTQAQCTGGSDPACVYSENVGLTSAAYDATWAPGGVCSDNNWDDYLSDPGSMADRRGDPRLIVVPVTEPGAAYDGAGGSAGNDHPVRYFAAFYVTGWEGDDCDDNDPRPAAVRSPEGAIWGHFLKFVVAPSSGTARTAPCDPETVTGRVTACIATVVR